MTRRILVSGGFEADPAVVPPPIQVDGFGNPGDIPEDVDFLSEISTLHVDLEMDTLSELPPSLWTDSGSAEVQDAFGVDGVEDN